MSDKIEQLKKAETEFISWLDNVNYSGVTKQLYGNSNYYRLIEGVKNGMCYNVSFNNKTYPREPEIIQRALFPRSEHKYTVESFYQWMKEEGKRKKLIFQAP